MTLREYLRQRPYVLLLFVAACPLVIFGLMLSGNQYWWLTAYVLTPFMMVAWGTWLILRRRSRGS
jgi:undecaprenyl pyrophosphate phosphatase UppP